MVVSEVRGVENRERADSEVRGVEGCRARRTGGGQRSELGGAQVREEDLEVRAGGRGLERARENAGEKGAP